MLFQGSSIALLNLPKTKLKGAMPGWKGRNQPTVNIAICFTRPTNTPQNLPGSKVVCWYALNPKRSQVALKRFWKHKLSFSMISTT